ncbi:MAG: hypothetical protein MK097_07475 [Dechloromonas sp.]|nr:hypothetical protein [Dechloromonas sp.]
MNEPSAAVATPSTKNALVLAVFMLSADGYSSHCMVVEHVVSTRIATAGGNIALMTLEA